MVIIRFPVPVLPQKGSEVEPGGRTRREVKLLMPEKFTLQQLLENEFSILKELNELSLQKKEVLLKNDLNSLENIVFREEVLSVKLQKVEADCSQQVRFFLKRQDDQNQNAVVAAEINGLIRNVRNKAQELKRNNQLNQDMIRDSLGIFRFMINALSPQENKSVYGPAGELMKPKKAPRTFDYKL